MLHAPRAAATALALAGTALLGLSPAYAGSPTPVPTATTASPTATASSTTASPTSSSTSPTSTSDRLGTATRTGTPGPTAATSPAGRTSSSTSPAPSATSTAGSATTGSPTSTSRPVSPQARLVPGGTVSAYGPQAVIPPDANISTAQAGAGYLARELAAGNDSFQTSGYADWGLTADAVLGMDAAGAAQTQAAATTQVLADNVTAYIGSGAEIYAGAVAKTLNVAVAQGVNPASFGGVDLVATLQSLESSTGRFSDKSQWGDYSNAITQSLALIGLQRAGATPSAASTTSLTSLQCADGGFALYYVGDQRKAGTCVSDPDATAYAVQALIAVNGANDPAAVKGLDFLAGKQGADGGVGGGTATEGVNANSTGLAAQAFAAGGRTAEAAKAVAFLNALQYDCSFPAALRGGVAYDQAAFDAQKAAGADAVTSDQDRRSTAQAVLGMAGVPLAEVTATGASAQAPTLDCAPAPSSSTTTSHSSSTVTAAGTTGTMTAGPGGTTTVGPLGGAPAAGPATTCADFTTTIPSTDPRYHAALDSDADGIGCEANEGVAVGADAAPPAAGGPLAYTGAEPWVPLGLGAGLLAVGGALVAATRRRGRHLA